MRSCVLGGGMALQSGHAGRDLAFKANLLSLAFLESPTLSLRDKYIKQQTVNTIIYSSNTF